MPLLFKHDNACILRAGNLLRPCGACQAPAAITAKTPALLPQKRSMNEDLQEFGRPTRRRIVFDSGSKNILVFPSDINADVFLCDTARAHTWVSSFQNVAERPIDFISYKLTYLNYVPKSSGTNNNSNDGHGYPPYDPDHSIWASISGISGMNIKDSSATELSSFPLI